MSTKSKTKGRNFEYKVRDLFSEAFDSKFERVPLSGALKYLKGDVYAPWLPDFPWCIEAKNHKEVNWNGLLSAKSSNLYEFWEQTKREADVMEKSPLLIYKWDRSKIYCCWDDSSIMPKSFIQINCFGHSFYMALLDDWIVEAKKHYKKPN